jgi:uncharacterized protein YkwD
VSVRSVQRFCAAPPRRAFASAVCSVSLALGLGTVGAVAAPTAAFADAGSMESQFVAGINAARAAAGMAPYSVAGDLISVARSHSSAMASSQSLYHNPSLTTQVTNWQVVGENVGEGPSVNDLRLAFMNSPEHRANILDRDYTQVGVGVVVDSHGTIWVTEDFRQPMGGSSGYTASSGGTQHSSTGSSSGAVPSTYSAASAPVASAPVRPQLSPREVLMQRLHRMRHQHREHHVGTGDPVAQAFHYVASLSRLTA